MKKLVLIDGHALVHRAFHALPPLATPSGVPTNAIFGFMSVMIKMIKDLKPDYIAAAFDLAGPTFRHEEFAEYKSHRVRAPDELHAQVPYIKELLLALGVPIFEKAGFEADDVVGTISQIAKKKKDLQVVIMTGDLDTLQLVEDDKVVVFTLRKGMTDTMTYGEKEVKTRYGLVPAQLVDYRGLKGDPSDNIPGVPGIGDVTASSLIQKFKSLELLYKELEKQEAGIKKQGKTKTKPKPPLTEKLTQKLLEFKDQAFFSKKLSTIICDVDVDFDIAKAEWRAHWDKPKLEALLKDLALYSVIKRLGDIDGAEPVAPAATLFNSPNVPRVSTLISDEKAIAEHLASLAQKSEIVIDITDGIILAGTSSDDVFGFVDTILKNKKIHGALKDILENPKIGKVGHDIKVLARWALKEGIVLKMLVFDTKLAAFVLNADIKDFMLEKLYFMEFSRDLSTDPLARITAIRELRNAYAPKLEKLKLLNVLMDIELPLSPVLAQMENAGILVDRDVVSVLKKKVQEELDELEKEIYKAAGQGFNINSPQQLSGVLFDTLGLKGKVKKTGKGAQSTAASELEKLIDEHPIVASILKYRELQKLKTTYIEPFPALIEKDGRVHTTYDQTGAVTGRLSSKDPNLQNIPIRTELGQEFRKAFIADKGTLLVSCDYSQLELRIAAHISGDKNMIEAFKNGEDIHTRTASQVFGVNPDKVTKDMRRQAKVLNFGVLYGMGVLGFQRASGVSRDQARMFIDNYLKGFPGLAVYMEATKAQARKIGYVETIFGRRRPMPDILSTMPMVRAGAERMAINHPIQGTEADLLKLAMISVQKYLESKHPHDAKMLLTVHDELLFEIKKPARPDASGHSGGDIVAEITSKIKKIMESVQTPQGPFRVPIVVDAKRGSNWADMSAVGGSASGGKNT